MFCTTTTLFINREKEQLSAVADLSVIKLSSTALGINSEQVNKDPAFIHTYQNDITDIKL